jgi:hypothetical protein
MRAGRLLNSGLLYLCHELFVNPVYVVAVKVEKALSVEAVS